MIDNNLLSFPSSTDETEFRDALSELIRQGARQLIAQAVEAELNDFLEPYQHLTDDQGRRAVVRNGYLPQRSITTGVGAVEVKVPKIRDRSGQGIKFNSLLLPPYLKRANSVEEVLPWLYLKGISTGDFSEALTALLGPEVKGVSATTISRLKTKWDGEYQAWTQRSLAHHRFVYLWADGIYFNIRNGDRDCMLVVMGVTDKGVKELIGIESGYRESELSWLSLLQSIKDLGLRHDPDLAIGDGALGFWKALPQVFPSTRKQRCWVHKTANVLNKLPKKQQSQAKSELWNIYRAETKDQAKQAFERFIKTYQAKYPEASRCLEKDRDVLFTFFDFPAEHWSHIRSTNPIESTFATVRLRTKKTRGCVSRQSIRSLVFKLIQSAQKRWRRIKGFSLLAEVIEGIEFKDGLRTQDKQQDAA